MNLKFIIIDLESTLIQMKTGIFILATVACIHTLTHLCLYFLNERTRK